MVLNIYVFFSEYDVTLEIDSPLKIINNLIQKISLATKNSQSIFFLDEVFGKNHLGERNIKCDWTGLKFYKNVDVLMAVNPQGIEFNQRFDVIVPTNEDTFARRLVASNGSGQTRP